MRDAAPYFAEVAEGPTDVRALWVTASDGVRLRLAIWPGGDRGTVLLFAGRTEYLEKYGHIAGGLRDLGLSTISLDWRGQGLSDRLLTDPQVGHVGKFEDYQRDVAALMQVAQDANLPAPNFLLAHSMGGCIGLRAIHDGLPVQAVCFTAPMWGIVMRPVLRPVAWGLSWAARLVGQGHRYVPGTQPVSYMSEAEFADNLLTTDPDMFAMMQRQLTTHPEFSLGGPSLNWLYEALVELRRLAGLRSPDLPCLTILGGNERVVATAPIRRRMQAWPGGRLDEVAGAEHEVLMDRPEVRARAIAALGRLFLGENRG